MTPLELQLNGYGGVDFNTDDLSLPAMQKACAALKADGGGRMLATVITDQLDRMVARIERLAEFHAADAHIRDAIAGIHVEGPFISPLPGYVGAHPAKHVLPAEVSAASGSSTQAAASCACSRWHRSTAAAEQKSETVERGSSGASKLASQLAACGISTVVHMSCCSPWPSASAPLHG